jgi:ATP-dependent DNA helicase RecG
MHGWETYPNVELKLTDLDEEEIQKTVRLGIECGRLPETTGNDIPTILEKLDVLDDGVLKNAAAVLFAKKKLTHYPQNLLRLARFKGTDKTVFIDSQRVYGNLFRLLDAAMAFLFKHLSLSGTTETLERKEALEIPYKAIREAVINSLCHRSYRDSGGSVAIAIYDDRVEIDNPGSFPSGWDMARIKSEHGSRPRNPLIADTLYVRKLLESWGRGISLMIEECKKADLQEPEFQITTDEVKVIFHRMAAGQATGQATGQAAGQATGQATRQVMALVRCLGENELSVKEIMERLSLKGRDNFLKMYLYPVLQDKLVEQTHPEQAKHPEQKYRLTKRGKALLN